MNLSIVGISIIVILILTVLIFFYWRKRTIRNAMTEPWALEQSQARIRRDIIVLSRETDAKPKSRLLISVAHPQFLSKRFTSSFLVQLSLPTYTFKARRTVTVQFKAQQPVSHEYKRNMHVGQVVKIKLTSPAITFSDTVVEVVTNKISPIMFLAQPQDNCQSGVHHVMLSISDSETEEERQSMSFPVSVVDFVFDHVSRPFLSNVTSVALGIGSVTMFMLTLGGKIDTTLGVASGITAGVLASGFYYYIFSAYQRRNVNIP